MYTARLSYFEGEVIAFPANECIFPRLDKVVYFSEPVFMYVPEGGPYFYYGTQTKALPQEFLGITSWDISIERRLYYALGGLGVVRSIATMYPTAER